MSDTKAADAAALAQALLDDLDNGNLPGSPIRYRGEEIFLHTTGQVEGWLRTHLENADLIEAADDDWEPETEEAPPTTATAPTVVHLAKPYLGWLNHYEAGWQAAIVRRIDGQRWAYRLGEPLPYERATDMCRVLSEVTGVPVAGELSKQGGFLPVSMGGAR
jgi:hypothetical protein